uniref:Uncharacterized protein n=1 Tax=Utricularia reniformis TaxID=192314 RepID=A0A1Y0B1T0_9LAMI|nr:hypothetical protein AEK19_MT1121 [Utricularia reniformis]ART31338.1 hypothetical protein AEK19_MT1121 [Utricularia reniformis]
MSTSFCLIRIQIALLCQKLFSYTDSVYSNPRYNQISKILQRFHFSDCLSLISSFTAFLL